jgi:hypothetical protein
MNANSIPADHAAPWPAVVMSQSVGAFISFLHFRRLPSPARRALSFCFDDQRIYTLARTITYKYVDVNEKYQPGATPRTSWRRRRWGSKMERMAKLNALLTKLFCKASTGSVPRAVASVTLANGRSLPLAVLIRRLNSV